MTKIFSYVFAVFLIVSSSVVYAVNLPTEESGNPSAYCKEKWTKRGELDQEMYSYCLSQEHDGYLNLVSLANKYANQKWIQEAVNFSLKKWTNRGVRQDEMVFYALNKITEGWEDLLYLQKQPGWNQNRFKACSAKWGIEFDMVVYCYKGD